MGWARRRLLKLNKLRKGWGTRGYQKLVTCSDILEGWEALCYPEGENGELQAAAQLAMLANLGADLAVVEVLRLPISVRDPQPNPRNL